MTFLTVAITKEKSRGALAISRTPGPSISRVTSLCRRRVRQGLEGASDSPTPLRGFGYALLLHCDQRHDGRYNVLERDIILG